MVGTLRLLTVVLIPVHPVLGGCEPCCIFHCLSPFVIKTIIFSVGICRHLMGHVAVVQTGCVMDFTETEYKMIGESELKRAMSLLLAVERRGAV